MLNTFKNFNADGMDIDQLVALHAFGRQLRAEYEALQVEEPEWVGIQIKSLKREIHARNADTLESRKREISVRLDALKAPDQRRAELVEELEKINKQLQGV